MLSSSSGVMYDGSPTSQIKLYIISLNNNPFEGSTQGSHNYGYIYLISMYFTVKDIRSHKVRNPYIFVSYIEAAIFQIMNDDST